MQETNKIFNSLSATGHLYRHTKKKVYRFGLQTRLTKSFAKQLQPTT